MRQHADATGEHEQARLVVIDPDPARSQSWLSPAARAVVDLVAPDGAEPAGSHLADGGVDPHLGLALGRVGHRATLTLPLDGPERALGPALQALSQWVAPPRPVLLTTTADGAPPPPVVLALVASAGFLPGVDLRAVEWVADDTVQVARPNGIVALPHRLGELWGWRQLARLLIDLGCVAADSPGGGWLAGLMADPLPPERQQWTHLLRATYIEQAVAAIRHR